MVYRIDSADRITYVSRDWLAFAAENDAPELSGEKVIGRPIWDFVAGKSTRHLYQLALQKVRASREVTTFPFRCDAPRLRRYMKLTLRSLADGQVEMESRTAQTAPREHLGLLDVAASRSHEFLTMCSWCKRVRTSQDNWSEVEDAIREMHLFASEELPQISHGLCPKCEGSLMKALA